MISLSDDQLMQITISYNLSNTKLSPTEYLQKIEKDYMEFTKSYKSLRQSKARIGNKSKLGL